MTLAIIFSMLAGTSTPINTILFANFLQAMVHHAMHLLNDDEFMRAAQDFAVFNVTVGILLVILSYAATVLMNIAAFNQVYKIRQEYLKAALNQDFEYFDTHKTGDFASKMTE